ncbi:MAG TPA: ornithine carbamoyltransferase, partial [Ktedonobacteraceae bacterium]|nr:ornithine carbamoyltransferase [Ktedonobacteraceae bacterium]
MLLREVITDTTTIALQNRHFLKLDDFTAREIRFLLQLSTELKAANYAGAEKQHLKGKRIALIFEKDSTRTRSGFEVAAFDQGANVSYIGSTGSHIGSKETMKDTARVLGRMYDGIGYRGFAQAQVEELARYAGVPVWNGLTNEAHPTQVLADLLTMQEHTRKPLQDVSCCFLGDTGSNVADSLMIGAAKMGMDMRLAGPKQCWPQQSRIEQAHAIARETGARITLAEDARAAVRGCDFVYTDVWVSMGEPYQKWGERIQLMLPYQVNSTLMAMTNNPQAKFMHCLP